MTSRSEHGKYIRSLATIVVAKGPVDTGVCRDALVNNVNHLADVCTQHRVSLVYPAGAYLETTHAANSSEWVRPFGLMPILIPLQRRPDGNSVNLVTTISVSISSDTLTVRLLLSSSDAIRSPPPAGDECAEVTTTSTTAVVLEPAPIKKVQPPRGPFSGGAYGIRRDSLRADGSLGDALTPALYLHMFWKSNGAGATTARLYGLHAHESYD